MITVDELRRLMSDLECDRVERTAATRDTDKFCEAITAFCNDLPNHRQPGYLLVGVRDDGTPSGLTVTDELLRNLGGLRTDGLIQPLPSINVSRTHVDGGDVAIVAVMPSDLPPVRYKGRVWIRVGPRRGIASEQEERILAERRVSKARTFDAEPCLGSSLSDLASALFRLTYLEQAVAPEVIAENHRELADQLASLRFFDRRSGCPTNAGIILFGKNPLEFLPGAYLQFLKLDGGTLGADVLAERSISGDLLSLLRESESLLRLQITERPERESLFRDRTVAAFPEIALRELLMNAFMHRSYAATGPIRFYWYSDRIEIQSPGGLYGESSPENFPTITSYRNPVIAEAMKVLGFVNKFGRGVARAQEALVANGNGKAEFEFDNGFVLAKVWARR